MLPLVSVVVPCRNAGPMLAAAVRSIFAQTHKRIEIVFVDNNSTDDSLAQAQQLAAESPHPFAILSCTEPGANAARNTGYVPVRGDYVQWFDADDALGMEKIARQVEALERDPMLDVAYCDWMASTHLPNGQRQDRTMLLGPCDDQITRTLSGVWYPPHSYLLRRAAADRLQAEQAWWPDTKVGTDVEYSAIAAMLGLRFAHVPGARIQYNIWSSGQISGSGTSYATRTAALKAVYARLTGLSERVDVAPRITPRHRVLLQQDWQVWAMPSGTVQSRKRLFGGMRLRHLASGRALDVDEREVVVADAMQAIGAARANAHHALMIADHAPSLDRDITFIVATLERFRVAGLLTPVRLA